MHEIITLQLGQQANYVGTHYWNTQESYFTYSAQEESPVNHDTSFRAGIGADGSDTYTPRTLIYDLKGAFGTLRRENELYELQSEAAPARQNPWGRDAMTLRLPPIVQGSYQQALNAGAELPPLTTDTVRFWSDYNHLFYHPRSIVQMNEYELNSSLMPFERFGTGEELFTSLDREHDLLDRDLRPFLEECDHLQGLQLIASTGDAWGGFASRYLERIEDELGKGCRWMFSLEDSRPTSRARRLLQASNAAQALQVLSQTSSMNVPVVSLPASLPSYLSIDAASPWHTGALQAAAIETLTLPTRLKPGNSGRANLDEIETILNNDGRRPLAAASASFVDPTRLDEQTHVNGHSDSRMVNGLDHSLDDGSGSPLDIDFFSNLGGNRSGRGTPSSSRNRTFTKYEVLRGSFKDEDDIEESNLASRQRFTDSVRTVTRQTQLLFPLLKSYPNIFSFDRRPAQLAVRASVNTSNRVAAYLADLAGTARQAMGTDEREALYDSLMALAAEYEESMGFDEEEDGDDDE